MVRRTKTRRKATKIMFTRQRTTLGEVFGIIGDALATAAAVRQHRQPAARHLRGLGIDPEQFRQIRH